MKVVLANGVFDPFHYGHLKHLQAAKMLGYLVVSVTDDPYVNKGPDRPVFTAEQRCEMLKALTTTVDDVVVVSSAMHALMTVQPDIFVKGQDYRGKIDPQHYQYCKDNGIAIHFTDTPKLSSTALLSHYART